MSSWFRIWEPIIWSCGKIAQRQNDTFALVGSRMPRHFPRCRCGLDAFDQQHCHRNVCSLQQADRTMSSCVCLRWTARAGLAGACAVKSVMSAVRHTTRTGRRRKQSALNCSLQTLDNTAVIVAVTHAHVDKATLLWVTLHGFDMKTVVGFPLALFVCLFVCYLYYIVICFWL